MFRELMDEYYKKYGESFPTAVFKGYSEEELIEIIKDYLDRNVPYRDYIGGIY